MDLKQIEKLMAAMETTQMKRIHIKKKDFELELEKETGPEVAYVAPQTLPPAAHPAPTPHSAPQKGEEKVSSPAGRGEASGTYITSPMVGTFYSAPSPEDPPFVSVGDRVDSETVVCIVEAMKVMNEVKANAQGTIAEILVKNGDPVEFGTNIYRIES